MSRSLWPSLNPLSTSSPAISTRGRRSPWGKGKLAFSLAPPAGAFVARRASILGASVAWRRACRTRAPAASVAAARVRPPARARARDPVARLQRQAWPPLWTRSRSRRHRRPSRRARVRDETSQSNPRMEFGAS
eukprot:9478535-Pyramimonas_sp.AAC.1